MITGIELFNVDIPLWAIFLIAIIVVIIAWKVIKFAIKILLILVVIFLILIGLDALNVFSYIQNFISNII